MSTENRKPKVVVAPKGCCEYLTDGKEYKEDYPRVTYMNPITFVPIGEPKICISTNTIKRVYDGIEVVYGGNCLDCCFWEKCTENNDSIDFERKHGLNCSMGYHYEKINED